MVYQTAHWPKFDRRKDGTNASPLKCFWTVRFVPKHLKPATVHSIKLLRAIILKRDDCVYTSIHNEDMKLRAPVCLSSCLTTMRHSPHIKGLHRVTRPAQLCGAGGRPRSGRWNALCSFVTNCLLARESLHDWVCESVRECVQWVCRLHSVCRHNTEGILVKLNTSAMTWTSLVKIGQQRLALHTKNRMCCFQQFARYFPNMCVKNSSGNLVQVKVTHTSHPQPSSRKS